MSTGPLLPQIETYLSELRSHLCLDLDTEQRIVRELEGYFDQKITELRKAGLSPDEAANVAVRSSGRPRVIAQRMQEAHGHHSWTAALLASLPHVLVAALFAAHGWRHPVVMPLLFVLVGAVALHGWVHAMGRWVYPWVGYMVLLMVVGSYASYPVLETAARSLLLEEVSGPGIWLLLAAAATVIASLWFVVRVTASVVKRDWILASLMFLPLPVVASWLWNVERYGGLAGGSAVHLWDTWMCAVLVVFGVTSAVFVHFRWRSLKIASVVSVGVVAGTIAGHNVWDGLGLVGLAVVALLLLFFLLSPALLEFEFDRRRQRRGALPG